MLPLEKEFAGSFIGYLKHFRFYSCPLSFTEIRENLKYDKNCFDEKLFIIKQD
jgi:hypothetical protein